ncbi:hypothetical protein VP1G_01556 [Cytospora mali]|uniref:Uncharacterized protein n=1 Tax=Cytospora mali TaxID=578113 RepID=A0A194URD2_CYTMA|nr:hypothetical protein VP1G_01556 [Valsa mali var. pyri (nom. inval.)]
MTTNALSQAQSLQRKMEGTLLQLEKLGVLDGDDADEIRNIVAEGIAEKFDERYRTFPSDSMGVQIRRDMIPKPCVLKKRVDAHAKAIAEGSLPESVALARAHGNMRPALPRETPERQNSGAVSHVAANKPPVPKGHFYRKPDFPEVKGPFGRKSSPDKARKAASADQKMFPKQQTPSVKPNLAPKATSADQEFDPFRSGLFDLELQKDWQDFMASDSLQARQDTLANPPVLTNHIGPKGPSKAHKNTIDANQGLENPTQIKSSAAQVGQEATTSADADVSTRSPSSTNTTVDSDSVIIMYDDMMSDTEEHEKYSSEPNIDFGDDLIWLGD